MIVRNSDELNRIAQALKNGETPAEASIELAAGAEYHLKETMEIRTPLSIAGNGAKIIGNGAEHIAFRIMSGGVNIKDLQISEALRAFEINAAGKTIEDIRLTGLTIDDMGLGSAFQMGSTESEGKVLDLHITDCVINSGYTDEKAKELNLYDGANGFTIMAAAPLVSRKEDIENCVIDGLYIERCRVLGPRRYGITMLVGIATPEAGTEWYMQQSKIVNCAIRNVKVLDCEFDYCREMAVSLSGGSINNYGSVLENLEIAGCRAVYGICGIGFSAAGPIIPTSVSRDMYMRHGSMHDNVLILMDLPVNEPSCAINLTAARSEAAPGVEVYDCFVEDVDIYRNEIINADQGIQVVAANSMGDTAVELSGNWVRDIRIFENKMTDTRVPFCFYAAYAEGRRYDWKWGWLQYDLEFAPPLEKNEPTVRFCNNRLEQIFCHDNAVSGCATEVTAAAACGRGHAWMENNRIIDQIQYENNTFERSEGHFIVKGTWCSDWVVDAGGNSVSPVLRK